MAWRSALGASPAHGPPVSDPEQVNPPGNVTAETQGSRLRVRWAPPVSAFPGHCFDYEVRLRDSRKGSSQVTDAAARPAECRPPSTRGPGRDRRSPCLRQKWRLRVAGGRAGGRPAPKPKSPSSYFPDTRSTPSCTSGISKLWVKGPVIVGFASPTRSAAVPQHLV